MKWLMPLPRRRLTLAPLAVIGFLCLAAALALSSCENVAGFTSYSLVRFLDASYKAPAVDASVEGTLLFANNAQGSITNYAGVGPSNSAAIKIAASGTSNTLVSSTGMLLAGQKQSILLSDGASGYQATVLQDQATPAAGGHSAFRFLNQAPSTGGVDIYMVPASATLATTKPLYTDLASGAATGYISFASQTVTMVITPTGVTTAKYVSAALNLTGGEVRTVLITDAQLTTDPPIDAFLADDVD